ncbi:Zinc finger BED domain-containing protein RICESLEEPER 3, partial [Mucuna pruriens]
KKKFNGEEKTICNYCNKHLAGKKSNQTNHLHKHYQTCKRRSFKDIRQSLLLEEQKKIDESSTYLSNYHFVHEYSLSMVEHLRIRAYFEGLQPLFKVPSKNIIINDIIKIYQNENLKTMRLLDKIQSKIALTKYFWTTSNQKKWFMVITSPYIDDDWAMQSHILRQGRIYKWEVAKEICSTQYHTTNVFFPSVYIHLKLTISRYYAACCLKIIKLKRYQIVENSTKKVLPKSDIFNILGWWKTNGIKYPTLQKIAKDILAILISTISLEYAFST